MTTAAAIYSRISEDRDEDAQGVARQLADMTAYAERNGWSVVPFTDNDVSASRYSRKQRAAYAEMLRRVEAGEIAVILCWHLDRLYRQPKELEHLIDLADAGRVEVHTLTGRLDLRDGDGRAMARVVVAMAAKSSDDSSRRIRRKHQQMADERRWAGGGRPFGYGVVRADGTLDYEAVRAEEAALLTEAAERVLRGEGLRGIVADWNARAIPAPKGGAWLPRTLKVALLNPRTAGLRSHNGAVVGPARWPAIIPPARQEELRAILTDPARRTNHSTGRSRLLSGLLVCGTCGARMAAKPRSAMNGGAKAYACVAAPCPRQMTRLAEPLEAFVRDAAIDALGSPGFTAALARSTHGDDGSAELAREIAGLEARSVALEAAHVEGGIDLPTFKRMRDRFGAAIVEKRRALAARVDRRVTAELPTGDLEVWWAKATLDKRRAVLGAVLNSITVGPVRRGVRTFDPGAIVPDWKVRRPE